MKTFLPGLLILLLSLTSQAKFRPYSEAEFTTLQANNQPLVLHFHADWCPTCRKQKKVLAEISTNPKFAAVEILEVHYDNEKMLKEKFAVRGQSTLIYLKGTKEIARSQGVTDSQKVAAEIEKYLMMKSVE